MSKIATTQSRHLRWVERPIFLLRAVMVLAALVPAVMFAGVAWHLNEQTVSQARLRLDAAARIAEEHALKVFETNIALSNRVLDLLGNDDAATLLAREPALHDALVRMTANLPQLQGIFVMDETGHMVATNRAFPAPHAIDFSDRAFYTHHRKGGEQPYITEVLTSRTTGEPFFDVSLRRTLPGEGFGGAVSTSLLPKYFRDFYRDVTSSDENLGIALVRADGAVLASWPSAPAASDAGGSPTRMAVEGPPGVSEAIVPGDRRGLIAQRMLAGYPVRVVAWMPNAAVLAPWFSDLALLAAVMLPLTLALLYVAWVALATTRRSLASLEALQKETAQRQRAEIALQQAQKLEALGRLTGGVAHDFNNLLMVMSNNLYLHKRLNEDVAGSRELAAIDRAVAAGAKITHQLLSFSRRQTSHPSKILLQQTLPAMVELLMPALGSTVALSIDVDPSTHAVELDEAELELALINLALNAKDAMPGGGKLSIKAVNAIPGELADRDGEFVAIAVRDTGVGIPSAILERVFEPFFTTKPVGQGTGLGLSQVYGFCVRAGGIAVAQSTPGEGTEVRMYFPAVASPSTAGTTASSQASAQLPGVRVLLVEDNADVADATAAVLGDMGCHVTRAVTADEARTWLAAHAGAVDIVLSDIVMPGNLDGIDLAQHMRESHPGLPVLLMSGYSESMDEGEATDFTILSKPCAPDVLARAIEHAVGAREKNGRVMP